MFGNSCIRVKAVYEQYQQKLAGDLIAISNNIQHEANRSALIDTIPFTSPPAVITTSARAWTTRCAAAWPPSSPRRPLARWSDS